MSPPFFNSMSTWVLESATLQWPPEGWRGFYRFGFRAPWNKGRRRPTRRRQTCTPPGLRCPPSPRFLQSHSVNVSVATSAACARRTCRRAHLHCCCWRAGSPPPGGRCPACSPLCCAPAGPPSPNPTASPSCWSWGKKKKKKWRGNAEPSVSVQTTGIAAAWWRYSAKLAHLFMRGSVPSMLSLWFAAGVGTLAGSENIIRSMVHVVETFALEEGKWKNFISLFFIRYTLLKKKLYRTAKSICCRGTVLQTALERIKLTQLYIYIKKKTYIMNQGFNLAEAKHWMRCFVSQGHLLWRTWSKDTFFYIIAFHFYTLYGCSLNWFWNKGQVVISRRLFFAFNSIEENKK